MTTTRSVAITAAIATLILVSTTSPLIADVITDPCHISADGTLIDFEQFTPGATSNPLVLGNATFSSSGGLGIVDVSPWRTNGTEVESMTLQPVSAGEFIGLYYPMTITFDAPVSQVIFGWFDANFAGNIAEARDINDVVLETGAVETGPSGGCCAAYIGFSRPTADIKSVRIVPAAENDVYSIDHVFSYEGRPEETCVHDLNDDCAVDAADLAVLLAEWGGSGVSDFDDSGTVDAADLATLLANWGPCGGF